MPPVEAVDLAAVLEVDEAPGLLCLTPEDPVPEGRGAPADLVAGARPPPTLVALAGAG